MPGGNDAGLIQEVRLRAAGIGNNLLLLARAGLTQADSDEGEGLVAHIEQLNMEQETLKGALKLKTAEINSARRAIQSWRGRVTPLIKVALAHMPEKWIEFGIHAKK